MQFTFSPKQILFFLFLGLLLAAGLGLGAFFLGQLTALRLSNLPEPLMQTSASVQEMTDHIDAVGTLPVAMTATPKSVNSEEIVFTDAQATELARQQAGQADSDIPFEIYQVFFTPGQANLTGMVDYLGTSGEFAVVATPYVENNRLRAKVNSVTVEGQSLPGVLYAEIEKQLNVLFEQVFSGYDVQSVVVEQGQIRLAVIPW